MDRTLTNAERLAALQKRSEELDRQIHQKERRIRSSFDELFAPAPKPTGRVSSFVANASSIAAVVDGAILGYRLYRQFRKFWK